jgi:hypothetical protein
MSKLLISIFDKSREEEEKFIDSLEGTKNVKK